MDNEKVNATGWNTDVAQSEQGVSFFKNTIVRILIGVDVFFVLVSFGILGFFLRPTGGLLVLHYNVYFGVETEGIWWQIFIPPMAGAFFLFWHFFWARRFYESRERIAAYLMLFGACLISISVLVASAGIALINY
jgi:hypothetical protein